MTNIILKRILIFGLIFWLGAGTVAAQGNLAVSFSNSPLFSENDLKPGDSATGEFSITNNSGSTKTLAVEAINYPGFPGANNVPSTDLSRALDIDIREAAGASFFSGTLFDFFEAGQTALLSALNGSTKSFAFQISFNPADANQWQGATTAFDLLVGFEGEAGGQVLAVLGGGGGGGASIFGLQIAGESVVSEVAEESVAITWRTSFKATSRVIFSKADEPHVLNLADNAAKPALYGYARSTPETDTPAPDRGVFEHAVTILGLAPGTTYFYRTISHASPDTVSIEKSFTTRGGVAPSSPQGASSNGTGASGAKVASGSQGPALGQPTGITSGPGATGGNANLTTPSEGENPLPPTLEPTEIPETAPGSDTAPSPLGAFAGTTGTNAGWLILILAVGVGVYWWWQNKGKGKKS